MGNVLGCSSSGPSLATAVASADAQEARKILQSHPDAAFYQPLRGGKSMVAVAAGRGNLAILEALCNAAERARGQQQLQALLSTGHARGDSALMSACVFGTADHVDCITYLLSKGADAFCTTSAGDNCLHIAARNAHTHCIFHLLTAWVSVPHKPPCRLADAIFSDDVSQIKYVDLPNGAGMTALHLATVKGSAGAVTALLRQGGSADAQITGTSVTPWLAQGSTALHIAAARGFIGCVSILLEFQSTIPGMELRRIRNFRGLKPSQLARMGGHAGLARLLSDGPPARRHRRHRRGADRQRTSLSPDALLAVLVQRAKLLMALRSVSDADGTSKAALVDSQLLSDSADTSAGQGDDVAWALAEVLHAWRKGAGTKGTGASLMSLASAFEPPSGQQQASEAESPSRRSAKSSYAAAAIVQAAVNAMASCSGGSQEPLEIMPNALAPTTAEQAATALQAALRMLSARDGDGAGGEGEGGQTRGSSRRRSRRSDRHRHRSSSGAGRSAMPDGSSGHASSSWRSHSQQHSAAAHPEASSGHGPRRRQVRSKANPGRNGSSGAGAQSASAQIAQLLLQSSQAQEGGAGASGTPAVVSNPLFDVAAGGTPPGASSGAAYGGGSATSSPPPEQGACAVAASTPSAGWPDEAPGSGGTTDRRMSRLGSGLAPSDWQSILSALRLEPDAGLWEAACPPEAAPDAAQDALQARPPAASPAQRGARTSPPRRQPCVTFAEQHQPDDVGASGSHVEPAATSSRHAMVEAPAGSRLGWGQAEDGMLSSGACPPPAGASQGRQQASASAAGLGQLQPRHSGISAASSGRDSPAHGEGTYAPGLLQTGSDLSEAAAAHPELEPDLMDSGTITNAFLDSNALEGEEEDEDDSEGEEEGDEHATDDLALAKGKQKALEQGGEGDWCAICMDRHLEVRVTPCEHALCLQCAYQLCARGLTAPVCPFCRGTIRSFNSAPHL